MRDRWQPPAGDGLCLDLTDGVCEGLNPPRSPTSGSVRRHRPPRVNVLGRSLEAGRVAREVGEVPPDPRLVGALPYPAEATPTALRQHSGRRCVASPLFLDLFVTTPLCRPTVSLALRRALRARSLQETFKASLANFQELSRPARSPVSEQSNSAQPLCQRKLDLRLLSQRGAEADLRGVVIRTIEGSACLLRRTEGRR